MKFLLDSNILIGLLAGTPAILRERISACEQGEVGISAISFAEVALGSWRGQRPPMQVLEQIARRFDVRPFDVAAAAMYARLPFRRGSFDRLIAAHALSLGAALVTNNERDFADVPELSIENWTR